MVLQISTVYPIEVGVKYPQKRYPGYCCIAIVSETTEFACICIFIIIVIDIIISITIIIKIHIQADSVVSDMNGFINF